MCVFRSHNNYVLFSHVFLRESYVYISHSLSYCRVYSYVHCTYILFIILSYFCVYSYVHRMCLFIILVLLVRVLRASYVFIIFFFFFFCMFYFFACLILCIFTCIVRVYVSYVLLLQVFHVHCTCLLYVAYVLLLRPTKWVCEALHLACLCICVSVCLCLYLFVRPPVYFL